MFFRVPIVNFAGATHMEYTRVETGDAVDATFFRQDSVPEILNAGADACDWTNTGNDRASSPHAVTLFALASTYAFMQRKVLLAILWMKKSPMIGSTIGESAGIRNRKSCEIVTSTPSGTSENVQTTRIPFVQAFR